MSKTPSTPAVEEPRPPEPIDEVISNKASVAMAILKNIGIQSDLDDFTDVTVVVDGKEFRSHRFILSSSSGFFRAAFVSGMKEDLNRHVEITGISHECFSLVLSFIFKGTDVVNKDNIVDLWHAANQLDVSVLLELCEKFITKHINKTNCLVFYLNAKTLDRTQIEKMSWLFILKNFNSLWDSDAILDLPLDDAKLLVGSNDLNVTSEDHVVDFILRWASHDPASPGMYDHEADETGSGKDELPTENGSKQTTTEDIHLRSNAGKDKEGKEGKQEETENETEIRMNQSLDNDHYEPKPLGKSDPNSLNDFSMIENDKKALLGAEEQLQDQNETESNQQGTRHVNEKSGEERSRSDFLPELLSSVRICLTSGNILVKLLSDPRVPNNTKALSLIKESICYQMEPARRHDYCPPTAIHRKSSKLANGIIYLQPPSTVCIKINGECVNLYTLEETFSGCTATMFNNTLYFGNNSESDEPIYKFDCLKTVCSTLNHISEERSGYAMAAVGDYVYVIGGTSSKVERINVYTDGDWKDIGTLPVVLTNTKVTVFGSNIIVLGCAKTQKNVTVVQCFDTESLTSYRMDDIEGPPHRIATFKKGQDTFVLFRTGALWKLEMTDSRRMFSRYITMLWDFDRSLTGAVLSRDELILFGDTMSPQVSEKWIISVPGVFNSIQNVESQGQCFHNAEIPKQCLEPEDF